ncbi:response regulator [Pedobacter puniceum]|jgi:DNA-binding response OmpR family regulator|uniref:Response regulator n=1 Tax=Pedobacter puniceum TaxID=2666136 RepID=A0A7K0FPT3_9SPHI|nr:response regulator [Pedobacter puniceum]MRX47455.1 response regulator [Pedobacter puniceum]
MKKVSIAIIDDNYHLSENLKHLLVINDYHVEVYRTLSRAEAELKKNKPDLIICDLNLPDGEGYDIINSIRKNTGFNLTPIIVLTGVLNANVNELFMLGVSKIFFKPTQFSLLKSTIEKLLVKRREYMFFNKPFQAAQKFIKSVFNKVDYA